MLTVKLSVDNVSYEFIIGAEDDAQKITGFYAAQIQIVRATLIQYNIKADSPVAAQIAATGGTQPSNGQSEERWTSTKLRHGFYNDKHTFNVCGGRWEQYGVPIYDDIADIDPQLKQWIFATPLGSHDFVHEVTVVLSSDSKPKKVKSVK